MKNINLLFQPQKVFQVGQSPRALAFGHLNQDHHLDLVVVNYGDGVLNSTVSLMFGNGHGDFAQHPALVVGIGANRIVTGDIDGDGCCDLAVTNSLDNTIIVLWGNCYGDFLNQTIVQVGSFPSDLILVDLDGDGDFEIVVVNQDDNNLSVLQINRNRGISKQDVVPVGLSSLAIAVGYFDKTKSRYPNVVLANQDSNEHRGSISLLKNNGSEGFVDQISFPVGVYPTDVQVMYIEDKTYILLSSRGVFGSQCGILVITVSSNGQPTSVIGFAETITVKAIAVGDVDKDGNSDVIAVSEMLGFLRGDGNGNLGSPRFFFVGQDPTDVVLADFDHDGYLDAATANYGNNGTLSILLSNPEAHTSTPSSTLTPSPLPRSLTATASSTRTLPGYQVLISNNHSYAPSGSTSLIEQFRPAQDKIDLSAYPGITYADLNIRQVDNRTVISFPYLTTLMLSVPLLGGQTLTRNHFVCLSSTQQHRWVVQTTWVAPTNGTVLTQFDPSQDKIDLTGYNISCRDIQVQTVEDHALIRATYEQQTQIILSHTQASDLNENSFIFPSTPPKAMIYQVLEWVKMVGGPVGSVLSTSLGLYWKRGLLQNILYASDYWKGSSYIKQEPWVPENGREKRMLRDRHHQPIAMKEIDGIKLFTLSEGTSLPRLVKIRPHYYIQEWKKEPIETKLVAAFPAKDGKAWIKLNPGLWEETEWPAFFVQLLAKNGAILEQFECQLTVLKPPLSREASTFSLASLSTQDQADLEQGMSTAYSSTPSVCMMMMNFDNPALHDTATINSVGAVLGMRGLNDLMSIGEDPARYALFQELAAVWGAPTALERYSSGNPAFALCNHPALNSVHAVLGMKGINHLIWIGEDPTRYALFQKLAAVWGAPRVLDGALKVGMLACRLPASYDHVDYLLKTNGIDLQAFYETQGLDDAAAWIGRVVRPSLLLGGTTLVYSVHSDPLVLLVAAGQPEFGVSNTPWLSNAVYYLTVMLSLARAAAADSTYAGPLMALQTSHLLLYALVDVGGVAADSGWLSCMQSAVGLAAETLGFMSQPDLPIKILQGIGIFAKSIQCVELAWQGMDSWLPYSDGEGTVDESLMAYDLSLESSEWA